MQTSVSHTTASRVRELCRHEFNDLAGVRNEFVYMSKHPRLLHYKHISNAKIPEYSCMSARIHCVHKLLMVILKVGTCEILENH